jgi:hypothetical protein
MVDAIINQALPTDRRVRNQAIDQFHNKRTMHIPFFTS